MGRRGYPPEFRRKVQGRVGGIQIVRASGPAGVAGQSAAYRLLHTINPVLRGWTTYFQPGVSSATFRYLRGFAWRRVMGWLRCKHYRLTWKQLRRRDCPDEWWPAEDGVQLFNPSAVPTTRYRYRGTAIPSPWARTA